MLVVPPGCLFVVAALGLLLRHRFPKAGKALVIGSAVVLVLLSTPLVSSGLLQTLQGAPVVRLDTAPGRASPQAIVVLSAGTAHHAPEYGGESVDALTLQRVRYAALLQRRTKLPLLVTGGRGRCARYPAAGSMRRVLADEFGVEVRWVEDASGTTAENAELSAPILRQAGVQHVYLVTHAWHMPRAQREFERRGLQVTPAPTAFRAPPLLNLTSFLPSANCLRDSAYAFHEWIGWLWYGL